ncbi:hypothetical protein [Streptomyces dioscori]|nr:hypothetical protein [Streptomyces dioscori]
MRDELQLAVVAEAVGDLDGGPPGDSLLDLSLPRPPREALNR